MKNKITYLTVITLITLIAIVSCKRNNVNPTDRQQNSDSYSQQIMKRIEAFQKQVTGHFKDGTMMPLDTAVWNLEALLTNYGGYPDSASQNFLLKKAHFTLPVDVNGLVSMNNVQTVYQQMVDTITAQLNDISGNVKFLKFSDVQQDSVVGNTAYITSNNGYGQGYILGLYEPFHDDWIWGTLNNPDQPPYSGNCSGTDFSSDGSNEIQYRLNHPIAVSNASGYTDLETQEAVGLDFMESDGTYRIYWDDTHTINKCLTINDLTYYLTQAYDIVNTTDDPNTTEKEGIRPFGKSFISINILDDMIVAPNNYPFLHHYYATYGIPFFGIQ